jgi:hypothetical protein
MVVKRDLRTIAFNLHVKVVLQRLLEAILQRQRARHDGVGAGLCGGHQGREE